MRSESAPPSGSSAPPTEAPTTEPTGPLSSTSVPPASAKKLAAGSWHPPARASTTKVQRDSAGSDTLLSLPEPADAGDSEAEHDIGVELRLHALERRVDQLERAGGIRQPGVLWFLLLIILALVGRFVLGLGAT